MSTLIVVVHVVVCLMLICIVLLQTGKGADMGAAFGGSSQALFGGTRPQAPFSDPGYHNSGRGLHGHVAYAGLLFCQCYGRLGHARR